MTKKQIEISTTAPVGQKKGTVKVYEPHAGMNDDPAEHQADMDPAQKQAATLADGSAQSHRNVRKTATRADGPDTTGVKVAPDTADVPTEQNTAAEIKAYLDEQGIDYPSNANKADLVALIPNE